ncbi:sulfatase [Streptomyces sp. MMBL 11-3]|uniref:sulfatase n=1 Tax=Streptomyces sp. MMBL 11-3 TaxID=3382639 RepID=UPI0039B628C7
MDEAIPEQPARPAGQADAAPTEQTPTRPTTPDAEEASAVAAGASTAKDVPDGAAVPAGTPGGPGAEGAPEAKDAPGGVGAPAGAAAPEASLGKTPRVDTQTPAGDGPIDEEPADEEPAGRASTGTGTGTGTDAGQDSAGAEEAAGQGSADADADADADAGGGSAGGGSAGGGAGPAEPAAPRGWRAKHPAAARNVRYAVTTLAAVLVLFALLMPNEPDRFQPAVLLRLPVEAIFGAAVLIVLPKTLRLVAAVLAGLGLGALTVLNLLDLGFNEFLGRGFNVVLDWVLFDDARSYLEDSMGKAATVGVVIAVIALVIAVFALIVLSVVRLANLLARHGGRATRATLVAGTVWVACSALGVQFAGVQFAARSTAGAVQNRVDRVQATLKDEAEFAKIAKKDTFANTPGDQLLTDLRGKDVIIGFIESYGRSAIEDPIMAPGVDATLDAKTEALTEAGYAAKSGWLTSATYGGSSWLGHSTFLSGLWISNQARYRTVTAGEHLTLTGAFKRTGAWRTVGIMPGVQKNWPEGKFYGLDNVYDSRELGYEGPKFSWSTMPDQYALSAYQRLEHGKKRDKPLMSEIILTSSHQPWAPIPKTIPWEEVGDGSVYEDIQKEGKKASDVFYDSTKVKEEYGKSIEYSVTSLIDYVVKYGNKNTVLVFLGDHQPLARVSGNHASRDVPVSIVAHDKSVLDKIDDWGWTDGLRPDDTAPVWRMDSFRDRFLTAYGSTPHP